MRKGLIERKWAEWYREKKKSEENPVCEVLEEVEEEAVSQAKTIRKEKRESAREKDSDGCAWDGCSYYLFSVVLGKVK